LRSRAPARAGVLAALAALSLSIAGCGLAVGSPPTGVRLLVTRDFGSRVLSRTDALKARAGETVMSLLAPNDAVGAGAGGRVVDDIDGVPSGREAGHPVDWFYYVNGVQARRAAAVTSVHPGDHIWWDLHAYGQAATIPAVVGSFPEPFLNGIEGKRLPVRVECASVSTGACDTVTEGLRRLDVPAAIAAIGSGGAPETLRVMVGPWVGLEGLEAQILARGPRASGVYARFSSGGHTLTLLGQNGQPVQTLHAGAGLVAATRQEKEAPVWEITGTDEAGVGLAARAFNQATLADRFAVAVVPGGAIALPEPGR
jgi:hypothetical protein